MPNKTIKAQIVERVLAAPATVRDPVNQIYAVRESNDYTAQGTHRSELIAIVGTEAEQSRDAIGQVYQFDLHVKMWVPHPPPPYARKDYRYEPLAARIIQALEDPGLLAGLGTIVIGAEEQTFLRSGLSKIAGPWVRIAVQYSRKRANPFETYDASKAQKLIGQPAPQQAQILEIY